MQGKFAYIRTYTHVLPQPSSMHRMTSCMPKEMQKETHAVVLTLSRRCSPLRSLQSEHNNPVNSHLSP